MNNLFYYICNHG